MTAVSAADAMVDSAPAFLDLLLLPPRGDHVKKCAGAFRSGFCNDDDGTLRRLFCSG